MLYHVFKLLSESETSDMVTKLMMSSEWRDGAESASGGAKLIKKNLQLSQTSDTYSELRAKVVELLMNEKHTLGVYIYPKKIVSLLFSRTSIGMYYKRHLDIALVEGDRKDYSFTIFLNNPSDYDGGELILNVPPENKSIKLNAGSIIIYPTKYMHEVKEVTRGERIVCVGWIESYVKRDEEREILALTQIARAHVANTNNGTSIPDLDLAYQRLKKYFAD